MQASKDEEILARALREGRVLVSADADFGMLLALQEAARPSFILFRETELLTAQDYLSLLTSALPEFESELIAGCVVVFRRNRLRLRRLPFSG